MAHGWLSSIVGRAQHGAPLRLYLSVQYGYKSLKRVGLIRFQDERPPDYWAGPSYHRYAGR
jgi:DMSO/TMAO reductase YedYZ molybdopterin-dependent catalytic subunit